MSLPSAFCGCRHLATSIESKAHFCLLCRVGYAPSIFNYRFPVIQHVSSNVRHFSTFFAHFGLPWVRPWDNCGKCYMDQKRIQCLSNASQHVSIYLQPFTSYSEILVGNCNCFLTSLAFNAPVGGVPIGIPGKVLVLIKLESWGYQAVKTV